jgi:MFS family permease
MQRGAIATGLAPTLGPVLGGLLVTGLSWRAVFYVNVPVGICATIFGALFLRRDTEHRSGEFDVAGFLLSAVGLGLVMYGVSVGPSLGWSSAEVLGSIAVGMVLLGVLVIVELRRSAPIMDIRLLGDRLLGSGSAIMAIESVAFLGTLYTVSLYFQDGRGLSPLASGLSTFPEAVGVMTGSQLGSRILYSRLGPRRHLIFGVALSSLCISLLGVLGTGASLWLVRIVLYFMGFAVGQVFVATQAASFATISPAASGQASTLFNVGRRLGGAIGVAVSATAIMLVSTHAAPGGGQTDPFAYRIAFLGSAALNLLGLWWAWTVRDRDAASTIPQSPRKKDSDAAALHYQPQSDRQEEKGIMKCCH